MVMVSFRTTLANSIYKLKNIKAACRCCSCEGLSNGDELPHEDTERENIYFLLFLYSFYFCVASVCFLQLFLFEKILDHIFKRVLDVL